jgi:WD40 repeat protein
VRVWDAKTTDCLRFFSPSGAGRHITELTSIHSLLLSPLNPEYIIVGSKSNTVHLMNLKVTLFHHRHHHHHHLHLHLNVVRCVEQGKVIKSYFSGKKDVIFLKCITSKKGGFIYAVGEDRHLYCFNANTGNLDYTLMVRSARFHFQVCVRSCVCRVVSCRFLTLLR